MHTDPPDSAIAPVQNGLSRQDESVLVIVLIVVAVFVVAVVVAEVVVVAVLTAVCDEVVRPGANSAST